MSFTSFIPENDAVMDAIANKGNQWFNDADLMKDLVPHPSLPIEGTSVFERAVVATRIGQNLVRRSQVAALQQHISGLLQGLEARGALERTTETIYGEGVHIFSQADVAKYGGGTIYRMPLQQAEANPAV